MNTFSFTSLLTHSLAWALLYSLWQGLIVYGVLFIVLQMVRNVRAHIKYHLATGAFLAVFAWFANTWMEQYQRLKGITIYITEAGHTMAAPANTYGAATVAMPTQVGFLQQFVIGLERYSGIILLVYSIGVVVMLVRFALNLRQIKVLKHTGIAAPHAELNELVEYWQDRIGISRKVSLMLSSKVDVPMMLGIIRPVILLPVASVNNLSIDQLEAILMHELAHIRRNDYLLNILQTAGETILFFNPFVWLISAEIRKEREHCCDELVVAHTADPMPYASALAILESNRYEGGLSLAATGKKHQLLNRIKRIMEMKTQNINYAQAGVIALAALAIVCSVAMFSPSFAQKNKHKQDKKESTNSQGNASSSGSGNTTTTTSTNSTYRYKVVTIDSNGNKNVIDKTVNSNDDDDVNVSFSDSDFSIDLDNALKAIGSATKDVTIALSKTDKAELDREMAEARREIAEARREMANINWKEIRDEVNRGLDEADRALNDPKLRKEINEGIREGLEESRKALEEARKELHRKRISVSVSGSGSHRDVPDGGDYEEMLSMMEEDGLINREKGFSIAKSRGELKINGKVQPDRVYDIYKRYLKGRSVAISGTRGSLSVSVDD